AQVNALGEVSARDYDAFGNLIRTTSYGQRLSATDLTGLTGGDFDATVAAKLAALNGADTSVTTMAYTATGRLAEVTSPLGHFVRHTYDAFGDVISTLSDRDGVKATRTDTTYDHRGQAVATTTDVGGLNLLSRSIRDAFGRVTEAVDANGIHRFWQYDRAGNTIVMTDGTGATTRSTYDPMGRVLTRTDALGHTTSYLYNRSSGVTITTPEGITTTQVINDDGTVNRVTDGEGRNTFYYYDAEGRLTSKSQTGIDGSDTTQYDNAGHVIRTTDKEGRAVVYTYDAAGRQLSRTVDPDGLKLTTTYTYDAQGRGVTTTDPAGRTTTTRYDREGNVIASVVDAGGLNLTTSFTYDASGHVLRKTEGDGSTSPRVTQYTYDGAGRLVSTVVDPDGLKLTTTYAYDGNGNVVAVTDAAGHVSRSTYDSENRVVYTVDPLGAVTFQSYDAVGNVIQRIAYATLIDPTATDIAAAVKSASGDRVTRYAYDNDNRLRFVQQPTGAVTEQVYDKSGQVVSSGTYAQALPVAGGFTVASVTQAYAGVAQRTTRYVYDAAGRLAFRIGPDGAVVGTTYDASGLVQATTAYTMAYGGASSTLADLTAWAVTSGRQVTSHLRDASGRVVYTIDGAGYFSSYEYDGSGNVVAQRRYQFQSGNPVPTTPLSEIASLLSSQSFVVTRIGYDAAGRVTTRTDGNGAVTRDTLDALGRVVTSTVADGTPDAATTRRTYDVNGNLTSETRVLADGSGLTTAYVYDALGRRTQVIDPRGVAVSDRGRNDADTL
ncbi:hypothetical protein KCV01_g19849, partial [Aureobasidium melanogenum]